MAVSALRVLIVDDNQFSLSLLAALVRSEAVANIKLAKSGRDALAICQDLNPHIIFLDIQMPEMDGIETLHAIRELGIDTQVVMVSATATADIVKAVKEGNITGYIVKPVSQQRVGDAIRACIANWKPEN